MSYAIKPRRVAFDWKQTPLHWIPGEPTSTHVINVLHLLLPAGERWFEHRAVAFDMYQHAGGSGAVRYLRRVEGMAFAWPTLFYLWVAGARYLLRHDPRLTGGRYRFKDHRAAARRGLLPSWPALHASMPRYLRRSYHPSQEGSFRKAVEYLAISPAAQAAPTIRPDVPRPRDPHGRDQRGVTA